MSTPNLKVQRLRDELHRSRTMLRETRRRLARLYRQTPIMLHTIDTSGRLTKVNDEWLAKLGYEEREVIGQQATRFLTDASRHHAETNCLPQFLETGRIRNEELQFRTKSGQVIDVLLSAVAERDAFNRVQNSITVSVDITQRKRTERALENIKRRMRLCEDRLRSLSQELVLAEHNERRRIASDLHDQVMQSLAFSRMKLNQLKPGLSEASGHLFELDAALEQAIGDLRTVIYDMSPLVLDERGLGAAIEALAQKFVRQHNLRITVDHRGVSLVCDEASQVFLYRSVNELLTNVVKHAHADSVRVMTKTDAEFVRLHVEDDGQGFASAEVSQAASSGFGLRDIRARVERLGGRLTVRSRPGAGTKVMLSLPLPKS